jgi:hypothetical protein
LYAFLTVPICVASRTLLMVLDLTTLPLLGEQHKLCRCASYVNVTYLLHGAGYYLKSWLSLGLSKNILLSYGTRRFITVFTQARHWILSWASWVQFAP